MVAVDVEDDEVDDEELVDEFPAATPVTVVLFDDDEFEVLLTLPEAVRTNEPFELLKADGVASD